MTVREKNILYVLVTASDNQKFYFDLMDFDLNKLLKCFRRYVWFFELQKAFQKHPPLLIALRPYYGIQYFRINLDEDISLSEVSENSIEVRNQTARSKSEIMEAYGELSCGYCLQKLIASGNYSAAIWFEEDFNIIICRPTEPSKEATDGKDV